MARCSCAICWLVVVGFCLLPTLGPAATPSPPVPWTNQPDHQRLPLKPSGSTTGFVRLSPSTLGILFTNVCSPARYAKRQNLMNGAGVALGDFDKDGWCDLYLCNREGSNALYRNLGNWRFEDVTATAGVGATHLISSGALFADLNGDGLLDLHVTSFLGPDALFLNRGDGTFTNVTATAGVSSPGAGSSSAAADLDGDGDLDLYVARFAVEALLRDGSAIATRMVNGQPVVTGRAGRRVKIINNKLYENGEPDLLLFNDGTGRFVPADWKRQFTDESGKPLTETPGDLGFTVQLRDIDGNGTPDIYVCNDFQTPDRIWIGDGTGRFRALPQLALRNMSYASMGVDFADIDRDGFLDFYTAEMLPADSFRHLTHIVRGADPDLRRPRNPEIRDPASRSVLGWNRGDGTYADIAWFSHTAASDWAWTPIFLDVDLDGYEDLLISSGYPHDVNHLDFAGGSGRGEGRKVQDTFTDQLLRYPPLDSPHLAWRNQGNRTFADSSAAWGFDARTITHGLALADLDNDGDLDVVGNSFNAGPLICRNDSPAPRIAVRLRGRSPNTDAIGAKIRLLAENAAKANLPAIQEQEMLAGGRYLSSDQPQRTFAAPPNAGPFSIEITWRSGRTSRISGIPPNSLCEITDTNPPSPAKLPTAGEPSSRPASTHTPLFAPIPIPDAFRHEDPAAEDFQRQPLLPWRLSTQGPGIAWIPARTHGPETLLLANGRGQTLLASQPSADGLRLESAPAPTTLPLPDDALGLLAATFQPGPTAPTLIVSVASTESGPNPHPAALTFDGKSPPFPATSPLPGRGSSPGPLAASDIDDDGDLDLIIAGRVIPGRYPEAAETLIFRNEAGRLTLDTTASPSFATAGLVTGALFTDLDGDARAELVLACEWGPIRVFGFDRGQPVERTEKLGLAGIRGLWQSLSAADFDGDGRMDLVAGNWGRNSPHQRAPEGPWQITFADLDQDGRTTVIESFFDPARREFVPFRTRDTLAAEMPWLTASFPKHADFGRASVAALQGEHTNAFRSLTATSLDSTLFLNRGHRFECVPLPAEAQWTPVLGLASADFDGDGDIDLFCSQNFFDVRDEEDRFDAGNGLLLRNDGQAHFAPLSSAESGILIPGQQRATAVSDFDADGRIDLAIAVNGGPPVILRNRAAPPGLRIRFRGPPGNPDAIGTQFRSLQNARHGPLQEIRAGNGHLGQDSLIGVIPTQGAAVRIDVRFPSSPLQSFEIPAGAREVLLPASGKIEVLR